MVLVLAVVLQPESALFRNWNCGWIRVRFVVDWIIGILMAFGFGEGAFERQTGEFTATVIAENNAETGWGDVVFGGYALAMDRAGDLLVHSWTPFVEMPVCVMLGLAG